MTGAQRSVMITGASGFLGRLAAAELLKSETVRLLLPVRGDKGRVLDPLGSELAAQRVPLDSSLLQRIVVVPMPPIEEAGLLLRAMRECGVQDIVHSAACLDYYDIPTLEAVNIGLTEKLIELAHAASVRRFIYFSTAYSSGYLDSEVRETLHHSPARDPTYYTRTKRAAEQLVAASGISHSIIRPSIVIGDSQNGRYSGKRYGLYQLWSGLERLMCREWHPEVHIFAPERSRASLIHQDAFQEAFLAAFRTSGNMILNLVSDPSLAPTNRQLWDAWLDACNQPRHRYYYERMDDIPVRAIPPSQRALLALASVNLEIVNHPWSFETTGLGQLRRQGLVFRDATLETVTGCQRQFIAQSPTIQRFLATVERASGATGMTARALGTA